MRKHLLWVAIAFVFVGSALTLKALPYSQAADPRDPQSPRMAALEKRVSENDASAVSEFWADIKKTGTPIVEPIDNDKKRVLVTFLWRGAPDTRNVVVFAGMKQNDPNRNLMRRVGTTDVWYRTYSIPSHARCTYFLSVNDSLVSMDEIESKDIATRTSTFKPDPLNQRGGMGGGSILELPDAPPQPWSARQAEIAHGQLENTKIKSSILNNERRVFVYTPPGYSRTEKPYNLMVMFDGPMYTIAIPTPTILDNLLAKKMVEPIVVVILDNPTITSRETEFACYEPFVQFIATEVIPWVREKYNVTTEASRTYVCGVSFGGLASVYIGYKHPEIFGNVISQSGSFWFAPAGDREPEWLTRQFAASPKLPLRFDLVVGLLERGPTPGNAPDMVSVNRHMRDVLQAKGYEVHYREYLGGHDPLGWRGALPEALLALTESSKSGKKQN